jgi:hypothetical protein
MRDEPLLLESRAAVSRQKSRTNIDHPISLIQMMIRDTADYLASLSTTIHVPPWTSAATTPSKQFSDDTDTQQQ